MALCLVVNVVNRPWNHMHPHFLRGFACSYSAASTAIQFYSQYVWTDPLPGAPMARSGTCKPTTYNVLIALMPSACAVTTDRDCINGKVGTTANTAGGWGLIGTDDWNTENAPLAFPYMHPGPPGDTIDGLTYTYPLLKRFKQAPLSASLPYVACQVQITAATADVYTPGIAFSSYGPLIAPTAGPTYVCGHGIVGVFFCFAAVWCLPAWGRLHLRGFPSP